MGEHALVIEDAPPQLVELPDELFLREFLAVDIAVDATLIDFVGQSGPLSLPMPDKDTRDRLVGSSDVAGSFAAPDVVGFRSGEPSYEEELEKRLAEMGDVRAAIETQHRRERKSARCTCRGRRVRLPSTPNLMRRGVRLGGTGSHCGATTASATAVRLRRGPSPQREPRAMPSACAPTRCQPSATPSGLYQAVIESWLTIDVDAGVDPENLGRDLDDEQAPGSGRPGGWMFLGISSRC